MKIKETKEFLLFEQKLTVVHPYRKKELHPTTSFHIRRGFDVLQTPPHRFSLHKEKQLNDVQTFHIDLGQLEAGAELGDPV